MKPPSTTAAPTRSFASWPVPIRRHSDERVRDAFLKGLDWLLAAQYDNGGWPMFYPPREGYYTHIDFNDNAQSGVMMLMDDVAKGDKPFDFVDAERRKRAAAAFAKGIDCILKCQIVVDGKRTAWCAQHDEKTFAPAPARTFEPVSLSGHESVGLVRCLMRVENPSPEIIAAVRGAVTGLIRVKIDGIRVVRVRRRKDATGPLKKTPTPRPFGPASTKSARTAPSSPAAIRSCATATKKSNANADWDTPTTATGRKSLLDKEYPAWATKWNTSSWRMRIVLNSSARYNTTFCHSSSVLHSSMISNSSMQTPMVPDYRR